MELNYLTINSIFQFMILFARIGAIFFLLPAFSEKYIPIRFRLIIALLTCVIIYPLLKISLPIYTNNIEKLLYYLLVEILIGTIVGMIIKIKFLTLHIVGSIIAMQSGLSAATFMSPNREHKQSSVFSNFFMMAIITMIFTTNTHHVFIKGIIESYKNFNISQMPNIGDTANLISQIINNSFILAFKISSPFLIISISILVSAGLLTRLMPNLQAFFVITPGQILIIFIILLTTLDSIFQKIIFVLNEVI